MILINIHVNLVVPGGTPYMIVGASDCSIRTKLVKSLALIVDDTLTWSHHINYISTKIKRGIGVMSKNSLLMLYRTLVETHLRYCNVVLGQCNDTLIDRLQILQNKAARVTTKVKYDDADHLILIC